MNESRGQIGQTEEGSLTDLLAAWSRGDRLAFDRLVPLVTEDLRRMARRQLALERPGHTLQPTEVVHEVYLRWSRQGALGWRDRAHFFAVAGAQIRHILVEHARRRRAAKRGHGHTPVRLSELGEVADGRTGRDVDLLDLDRALHRLHAMDPSLCRIVELRYFAGLPAREVAEVLGVTERTVLRHWAWIRAWLFRQLQSERPRRADHDVPTLATGQGSVRRGARASGR